MEDFYYGIDDSTSYVATHEAPTTWKCVVNGEFCGVTTKNAMRGPMWSADDPFMSQLSGFKSTALVRSRYVGADFVANLIEQSTECPSNSVNRVVLRN